MYVKPLIFNISRTSLHDGDGVRTVIYFKGCNLRCKWCHNPEGLDPKRELFFNQNKCIGCGVCIKTCSNMTGIGNINRDLCVCCGKCSENCFANALTIIGEEKSVEEIFEIILKDKEYYDQSGGGITLSGGECMLYPEFAAELLKKCYSAGINTLIESAFNVPWRNIACVIPYTDMFYVDIKHMDTFIHKKYTGVNHTLILENIKRLSEITKNILIRIPAIPNVNDSKENLEKTEAFARSLGLKTEILKYNNLAKTKYMALSKEYTSFDK